jgi:hypothetical protein
MTAVKCEQSAENMEYVRRMLKQKQPRFSAALESAADLVGPELESLECPGGEASARGYGGAH